MVALPEIRGKGLVDGPCARGELLVLPEEERDGEPPVPLEDVEVSGVHDPGG